MNYLISPCRIADQVLCLDKLTIHTSASPIKRRKRRIHLRLIYAGTGSLNTILLSVAPDRSPQQRNETRAAGGLAQCGRGGALVGRVRLSRCLQIRRGRAWA